MPEIPALAGVLLPLALACVCLLGIVGLRLRLRGAARFWAAPGMTALALAPAVAASGASALLFRQTLEGMALVGAGGAAAVAAGSVDALIPLALALASVAALAFASLLASAIGSSRVEAAEALEPGGGIAPLLAALATLPLAAIVVGLASEMVVAVNAGRLDSEAILTRWRVSVACSGGLALILLMLFLASWRSAPRGAPPAGIKLVSLSLLLLTVGGSILGLWVVYGQLRSLTPS